MALRAPLDSQPSQICEPQVSKKKKKKQGEERLGRTEADLWPWHTHSEAFVLFFFFFEAASHSNS